MTAPLVEQPDVETALVRSLTSNEADHIDGLCQQVSDKLRGFVGNIDDRITAGSISAGAVAAMLAGVLARFLNNPTEASSTSETIGPAAKSSSWSNGRVTGLVITADDLAQLNLSGPAGYAGAGTIRTRPGWPVDYGRY